MTHLNSILVEFHLY